MSKIRMGLVFGGRSEEHEISVMSARSVFGAADKEKYDIIPFAISKKGYWFEPEHSLKILVDDSISQVPEKDNGPVSLSLQPFLETELDLVFPVLHGPYGEDGRIQGFLEMIDIPYVGAGVIDSAIGMDKEVMKHLFAYHGIPQGNYKVLHKHEKKDVLEELITAIDQDILWPCFVKPANMGSSIGISKVNTAEMLEEALEEAFKYDHKVVIEEYISGREIECSIYGNTEISASLPGEIKASHEFYDYVAKYQDSGTKLVIPAELKESIIKEVRRLAVLAFKAVGARGFARVDFFVTDKDEVLVNEINTIPGFTRYSMYARMWEATGVSYSELIDILVNLALEWKSYAL